MRVFIGLDPRDAVSYNVLQRSIIRRTSRPVTIVPLVLPTLPIKRHGLTHFTFARYLVPWLCAYEGRGLFLDSDMLCLGDVSELFDLDFSEPVAVVKNKEKFEWPSLMMFNNDKCQALTPEFIDDERNNPADFAWAGEVAAIPSEWNYCVGWDDSEELPKLVHYTMGTPGFKELRNSQHADLWRAELESMTSQCAWLELHGRSVHRDRVLGAMGFGTG